MAKKPKTAKKPKAPRKAGGSKPVSADSLEIGKVIKDGEVELARPKSRISPWTKVFEQMKLLKKDTMFTIPIPAGVSFPHFRERFTSARRYANVGAPTGTRFVTSATKDGKSLAIRCIGA